MDRGRSFLTFLGFGPGFGGRIAARLHDQQAREPDAHLGIALDDLPLEPVAVAIEAAPFVAIDDVDQVGAFGFILGARQGMARPGHRPPRSCMASMVLPLHRLRYRNRLCLAIRYIFPGAAPSSTTTGTPVAPSASSPRASASTEPGS